MITKILKSGAAATFILSAGITKELIGEPKVDVQKQKCKDKIKELESLLKDKKDKLHKDFYFKTKSKVSAFHSEVSRIRDLDKLKKLEETAKDIIKEIKSK